MSLEPARKRQTRVNCIPSDRAAAHSIYEFCGAHRISRGTLYKLWREGKGPRFIRAGGRRLISQEAAADWRRASEAAA
jgi:hypothetical protein